MSLRKLASSYVGYAEKFPVKLTLAELLYVQPGRLGCAVNWSPHHTINPRTLSSEESLMSAPSLKNDGMGSLLYPDSTARFRVWAPFAANIDVILDHPVSGT